MVESAPVIGEIGAGIQVTPNLSRLLIRWGLGNNLKNIAVKPEAIALRRCVYYAGEVYLILFNKDILYREHW